ncbi:YidB family protein [Streptomyces roseoverticillatus]|uniref:YidB family protein n=1 Tax=Streptomyces roseoverticillatus TaxID=66429 RepID=UPI000A64B066|nr:YidB family protein [Streptomyces roseoverticillatus]
MIEEAAAMGNELGSLLGGLLGGGEAGKGGSLLGALLTSLGGAGTHGAGSNPLGALLDTLKEGGLGEKTDSWVGKGANQEVSGPEVAQALPYQALDHVAEQAGVTPEEAADQLAQTLPQAVDKLTPSGEVPEGSLEDLIRQQS